MQIKPEDTAPVPDGIVGVDVLMRNDTISVARLTLAPHGVVPWHLHTEIDDHFVALSGEIRIQTPDHPEGVILMPGQELTVAAGVPHRVVNPQGRAVDYLTAQGVGAYDRHYVTGPA